MRETLLLDSNEPIWEKGLFVTRTEPRLLETSHALYNGSLKDFDFLKLG